MAPQRIVIDPATSPPGSLIDPGCPFYGPRAHFKRAFLRRTRARSLCCPYKNSPVVDSCQVQRVSHHSSFVGSSRTFAGALSLDQVPPARTRSSSQLFHSIKMVDLSAYQRKNRERYMACKQQLRTELLDLTATSLQNPFKP